MNLIIIYGIGRNNNISEKYFQLLLNEYLTYKFNVEIHYYYLKINKINNPRSGEFTKLQKISDKPFNCDKLFVYEECDLKIENFQKRLKFKKDIYNDNYKSYRNLLCQLTLLEKVYKNSDFDLFETVCFIRDDVYLSRQVDLKKIHKLSKKYSFVSRWSWHGGYNDRFFFTNSYGAKIYSSRIKLLNKYLERADYLRAEELLKFTLKKKKINLLSLPIKTIRIRSNGEFIYDKSIIRSLIYTKNILELVKIFFRSFILIGK